MQSDLDTTFARVRDEGWTALDEPTGKAVLASFGIRVPALLTVSSEVELRNGVGLLAPPFALKAVAPGIVHKSDVGAVRLGLKDVSEVTRAIIDMRSALAAKGISTQHWLIEEMVPSGVEFVIGGVIDAEFGPMVMVGLGGIFVEILRDVSFRICPIERRDAADMLEELRGAPLMQGARGREPVSKDTLIDTLVAIGGDGGLLIRCAPYITELDINPLIVSREGAYAADARFILRR